MPSLKDTFKISKNVSSRTIDGEVIIVVPNKGTISVFNEIGSIIFEALNDEIYCLEEICTQIYTEFDAPIETIHYDVIEFIKYLEKLEIVYRVE